MTLEGLAQSWRVQAETIMEPVRNESTYFSYLSEEKKIDFRYRMDYSSALMSCSNQLKELLNAQTKNG